MGNKGLVQSGSGLIGIPNRSTRQAVFPGYNYKISCSRNNLGSGPCDVEQGIFAIIVFISIA